MPGTRVFGYFETDDREATERFLADQPVSERWQDRMSDQLMNRVYEAGPAPLEEIFRLE